MIPISTCAIFVIGSNLLLQTVTGLDAWEIISRRDWEAKPSKYAPVLQRKLHYLIVHSTFTATCYDVFDCGVRLRSIQNIHMKKGSADINYNYLIGGDGRVYEGRTYYRQGGHTERLNDKSIGVAFIGSFDQTTPSDQMVQALKDFYSFLVEHNVLKEGATIHAHSDAYCTSCPGKAVRPILKELPQHGEMFRLFAIDGSTKLKALHSATAGTLLLRVVVGLVVGLTSEVICRREGQFCSNQENCRILGRYRRLGVTLDSVPSLDKR